MSATKKGMAVLAAAAVLVGAGLAQAATDPVAERKAAMLERFDTNKDGKVDDAERQAAREEHRAMREQHKAEMLQKYDANRNGTLEAEEREKAHAERTAARFQELDTNRDGVLSLEEFQAGHKGGHHGGFGFGGRKHHR